MSNPLLTTRNIILALEYASDPELREICTVPLWEEILREHIVPRNLDLTVNQQQAVDHTTKAVDVMVRYYNLDGKATMLFLLECKRHRQSQYDIEQLEIQLEDYGKFLFRTHGVPRNPDLVYGGVAFGPFIRMFRITGGKNAARLAVLPIWGGDLYDINCYKDVHLTMDAQHIMQAFNEMASAAKRVLGTTVSGPLNHLPQWSNSSSSTSGSSFHRTKENLVDLQTFQINGKDFYSWIMPNSDNLIEPIFSTAWKKMTPASETPYYQNTARNVWAQGCKEPDQTIGSEAETKKKAS